MDIQAYIQSGIIESYVLGLANAEEIAELEMLMQQYPDIKKAADDFAASLERQAISDAVPPPARIKNNLLSILAGEFADDDMVLSPDSSAPVVEMYTPQNALTKKISLWRYIAAASVILLIASTALNIYFYSYKEKYFAALNNQQVLADNNKVFQTRLNSLEESIRIMQNPDMAVVQLGPSAPGTDNHATVYWDTKTKEVYLSPVKLPEAPTGKQYQLWAIVDGKPVNAGLLDSCTGVCKMQNIVIPSAQKFAITLEDKGGSPSPHLDQLKVIGDTKAG